MKHFKQLIGKEIMKLFLILWAPWGEEKESDFDICFGFVFEDESNRISVVRVDKDDLWLPKIFHEPLPDIKYTWDDYYPRVKMWMKADDENCIISKEYYDVTDSNLFKEIINKEIIDIELIKIEGNPEPFGVKILFKDDYIISMPNIDGNTIETKVFNNHNNIENFRKIGKIIYSKA